MQIFLNSEVKTFILLIFIFMSIHCWKRFKAKVETFAFVETHEETGCPFFFQNLKNCQTFNFKPNLKNQNNWKV